MIQFGKKVTLMIFALWLVTPECMISLRRQAPNLANKIGIKNWVEFSQVLKSLSNGLYTLLAILVQQRPFDEVL